MGTITYPAQRGGRVIVQNGTARNSQVSQMNPQPRGIRPRPVNVRRGLPIARGSQQLQSVIYPSQRGRPSSQRGAYFSTQQRAIRNNRGNPLQGRVISNPRRATRGSRVHGRGIPIQPQNTIALTRAPRGVMNRGRQPVAGRRSRSRGRPAGMMGNQRVVTQSFDQEATLDYNGYTSSGNSF